MSPSSICRTLPVLPSPSPASICRSTIPAWPLTKAPRVASLSGTRGIPLAFPKTLRAAGLCPQRPFGFAKSILRPKAPGCPGRYGRPFAFRQMAVGRCKCLLSVPMSLQRRLRVTVMPRRPGKGKPWLPAGYICRRPADRPPAPIFYSFISEGTTLAGIAQEIQKERYATFLRISRHHNTTCSQIIQRIFVFY